MKIWKPVIAPGTYYIDGVAADGSATVEPFTVSAANVRSYLAKGVARLKAGVPTPIPLEHNRVETLTPAQQKAYATSGNTGFVSGWRLSKDGTLEAELDVSYLPDARDDAEIERRLKGAIKFVSPYISKEHIDGTGRRWTDSITHVALTVNPVFQGQAPFGASGGMSKLLRGGVALSLANRITKGIAMSADNGMAGEIDSAPAPVETDDGWDHRDHIQRHRDRLDEIEAMYDGADPRLIRQSGLKDHLTNIDREHDAILGADDNGNGDDVDVNAEPPRAEQSPQFMAMSKLTGAARVRAQRRHEERQRQCAAEMLKKGGYKPLAR